ncbi:MAG: PDDEXK nuclease domain-containing protein [Bacteroidia bacterium]
MELAHYKNLLDDIKKRIHQAQSKALYAISAEMILMYYDIGNMIIQRQKSEGWGKGVISKIANDLKNELSEVKGFSNRNLGYMVQFAREYSNVSILQQPVAKLPWGHTIALMQRVKDSEKRNWYACKALESNWGRDTLVQMIKTNLAERQGDAAHNFAITLPAPQSELAKETLKNPYIFDFMTLSDTFSERELETELIKHIEKFLLELGTGFAFVGRQYPLAIGDKDFYLDLLFYHLKLRCFVVIDLKKGDFKPEYAGKMNFYCSAVDDLLRHPSDNSTIGLILCQNNNKIFAEYALKDINKPIGISEYELTRILPAAIQSSLPSIEELEKELQHDN